LIFIMYVFPKNYDIIVVGGGHAGIEAALAAARMGCQTLLLTINADSIGQMSCNPAIGGQGKGQIVREIDALGGEMGRNTDMTGIQFRMLNTKKGPAVWSPRAQCDKRAYQSLIKKTCENQSNLEIKQALTTKILHQNQIVLGVETSIGVKYLSRVVIITTGTFLRGLLHIGDSQQSGGRAGDPSAMTLSSSLSEIGLTLERFKTGTPPRINKRTINFKKTLKQEGDNPVPFFSFWNKKDVFHMEQSQNSREFDLKHNRFPLIKSPDSQISCFITHTTAKTAEIIRFNKNKSPLYSGKITGIGPRYCPSIEDKIFRFADKEIHQIFLEPEGTETNEIYVNGLSTSMPYDIQLAIVQSIDGCEEAEIIRPAYAVEYDYCPPHQLYPSLESKKCHNLFLAGQINGTSGYEEAAGQGLIAGINASLRIKGLNHVLMSRNQAYLGVMVDDLVTKGTEEPYRMFTSRAEHRLYLRQDNADLRLASLGYEIGLLPYKNYCLYLDKKRKIENEINRLKKETYNNISLAKLLTRPEFSYKDLPSINRELSLDLIQQVEITIKYAGYLERQELEVSRLKKIEDKIIPVNIDFHSLKNLRIEARQKLSSFRPKTIGQASRISGVTPADISILLISLKQYSLSDNT
jgi:tRNA uridine 5-carboxymethylaminomethyl modification enzyme